MRLVTVSFFLVAAIGAVLFLLVWFLTNNMDAAKGVAACAVAALPTVSSALEKSEAKESSLPDKKMAIRSIEGFSISFPAVVAIGAVIGVAILNLGSFFGGVLVAAVRALGTNETMSAAEQGRLFPIVGLANLPILVVGSYLLGKWVSWRCAKKGILAVVLMAFLIAIINRTFDAITLTKEEWQALFHGSEKDFTGMATAIIPQFTIILIPGLFGYWRGCRQRTNKYMDYLLSALPEETRNSIVDLAFDEVTRVVDARRAKAKMTAG
ncbi:MAG: hypothetical protein FJX45_18045 [Alphaproteobacteria bacterium]|nr:hypothetical protein [Alphaproteobacteria bacterium]